MVKTPLKSIVFTIFIKINFHSGPARASFEKFKIADQYEATEGELNFHKRCTEAREIKISAGKLKRTYPKGFRQDIPRTQ